ncbi:hypothetical protein M3Y98_00278100 [Aphelenchoides besseyi]|nr:hypothetical protein M3Y98_00278100 [Aphelenchoides besseyi]KAI6201015.1 hypothetical protein M3Y96_00796100 [Aphelenchoides besseyi]
MRTAFESLSAPRTQQYGQYGAPAPQYQGQQPAPQVALPPVARAAQNIESVPIAPNQASNLNQGLTVPFSSSGYNEKGGGPVSEGNALRCDFEGAACCWANLPAPEDQIDWNVRQGLPDERYPNITVDGHYLIATAIASPSDEAQLTSCAIACASSVIRVRAKHWQQRALLQVCLRESFPESTNFNPLLNCQEFPPTPNGPMYTEVELPRNSVVDVVFVASDFVDQNGGSITVLDDIEIYYETDPQECEQRVQAPAPSETSAGAASTGTSGAVRSASNANTNINTNTDSNANINSHATAHASSIAHVNTNSNAESSASSFKSESIETMTSSRAQASKTETNTNVESSKIEFMSSRQWTQQTCKSIKCTFEDGRTCAYEDIQVQDSIRGLTTRFQVVKGQFMNRITGIKESPEGDFYAASFIYPNERAGLAADVNYIDESVRIRFQFYESTHGVQLKGCCDSPDVCPFGTDKFVSVADRMWKYGDFTCPENTKRVIFFCENSRTNQGACALDDVQVLNASEPVESARPLC